MTIMRHQTALTVGEGDVIEWRHLLLDWMPLAWLLYFLKLLTLTATYVATRSRLERQLAEQPEPIDEQSFRKAAHCRRFSTVPMGDDDENAESATLETVQSGYRVSSSMLCGCWSLSSHSYNLFGSRWSDTLDSAGTPRPSSSS